MVNASEKGSRRERELVNLLHESKFAVIRAPASGAATERELPDVLAGNGERFIAVEAKAVGSDVVYIDEEEIDDLEFFAEKFGAEPYIGVRFDREDWYFFNPENCYRTPNGNYRIKKETARKEGLDLTTITTDTEQQRLGV